MTDRETAGRRRTFGPVVLLGLAAGGLTAVAGSKPAVEGDGEAARAISSRLVSFDAQLPLVTALGLVVLACWGVLLVTRGRVRRAVAALGTLAGLGALAAAIAAYAQVSDQLRDELALVGIADPELSHTAWYWAAVAGAVLATAAGVLAVLWAPAWPEMGRRYDAPGAAEPAPTAPPEEQSSLDLWKAMDDGRDPTA
ncbi:Trp biosynthesis-associated membrane protein [Nocardioides sp. YIM 152315]|uniref:Trp biosynthesis-associated membrane protein n=1 Tax=Nocardioides sp. YIM 152315 TaxID=3031760 RepID=UPI0023DBEACE|nr:Trp biosynthesis-associated membrane protein [Nocardioides sp. YIM 152315]MDF1603104.1 Trp biosynthesis-associated membrane protein [Nocardioides sp. YIM 152315]